MINQHTCDIDLSIDLYLSLKDAPISLDSLISVCKAAVKYRLVQDISYQTAAKKLNFEAYVADFNKTLQAEMSRTGLSKEVCLRDLSAELEQALKCLHEYILLIKKEYELQIQTGWNELQQLLNSPTDLNLCDPPSFFNDNRDSNIV